MPLPRFAAAMARVDAAVFSHLSDATGLLDGEPVTGEWSEDYITPDGIATGAPAITLPTLVAGCAAELVSKFVKSDLVDGTVYTVVEVKPDGAGMTVLRLRKD